MQLRTLLRTFVVLVLVVGLAAVALHLYGGSRYRAARTRFTTQFGEPDFSALPQPQPVVTVESNAATWLLRGAAALPKEMHSSDLLALSALRVEDWAEQHSALAKKALAERVEGLGFLRRAAGCEAGSFEIDYALGADAPTPSYASLLRATRLLQIDARAALVADDLDTAMVDLETLASAIEVVAADPIFVAVIVAQAIDRQYLSVARDLLASQPDNPAVLDVLEEHLAHRALEASWRHGIQGDGALIASFGTAGRLRQGRLAFGSVVQSMAYAPFDRLFIADHLDDLSELGAALPLPLPGLRQQIEYRLARPRFWNRRVSLLGNVYDAARRLKALQSSYSLARAAVHYAVTGEVLELPLDSFTGEPALVAPLADGYSFEAPGAEDLWRELFPDPPGTAVPPFRWVVPTP